jgi:hypothetical protein
MTEIDHRKLSITVFSARSQRDELQVMGVVL